MFNNARIDKEYRKATTSVIIGVILCLLAVFGLLMAGIKTAQAVKNADHLNNYIVSYGDDRKDRQGDPKLFPAAAPRRRTIFLAHGFFHPFLLL